MKKGIQKDLTGKRFTYFTVIGFDHRNKFGKAMWKVKCDCGKEKIVQGNTLVSGNSRSCGCAQKEWMKKSLGTGAGEMCGSTWCKIKHNAKNRGYKIKINKNQAAELFEKQNKKCAISGVDLILNPHLGEVTASLDRIDSSKDYELDNIQWIHKDINKMKNIFSEKVFIDWIEKIWQFRKKDL